MAANRMQRIFQLRSSEKSFVSRISPRNPCLPAIIIFIFDYCKIYLIHNKRKNFVELIELGEVFALEKFPSQREATHTLQSWRIFQSWQKFGRAGENAWHFSVSDPVNRLILVKFVFSYEVLKTCVRRVFFIGRNRNIYILPSSSYYNVSRY